MIKRPESLAGDWGPLLMVALAAATCTEPTTAQWPELPAAAEVVPFSVVADGQTNQQSAIRERQRRVITTATEWGAFWAELHGLVEPKPAAPAIDFASQMVVAAAMGQRNTGGYSIAIEGVFAANGKLLVRVEERSPGSSCMVTQALTAPVTAAVVARSDAAVEFVERAITTPCG